MMQSKEQDIRYSRQVILPGVGPEGQENLAKARVLVVGMGGLGSPVSLYLAAAGVGTLGLADNDQVERSNLHRQILHDDQAVGRPKVEIARQRLLGLNPDLRIELEPDGVTTENALSLFSRYDLIVDGTDNFPTRYLINDAAFFSGKPLVYGSIFQFEGQVTVFNPAAGGPCYRCLFPELPEPGTVPNCAEAGVFGALCGIVGSWQASEAIKLLIGLGDPLIGRMKVLDTLSARDQIVALKKDGNCPLCGQHPSIRNINPGAYQFICAAPSAQEDLPMEIGVEALYELMNSGSAPELLDVRDLHERALCRIGEERHIPSGELQSQWESLPRDQHLVIYCHHGMRSLYAARFLREKGFHKVQSLQGGIDTWSKRVDPSVPRY